MVRSKTLLPLFSTLNVRFALPAQPTTSSTIDDASRARLYGVTFYGPTGGCRPRL